MMNEKQCREAFERWLEDHDYMEGTFKWELWQEAWHACHHKHLMNEAQIAGRLISEKLFDRILTLMREANWDLSDRDVVDELYTSPIVGTSLDEWSEVKEVHDNMDGMTEWVLKEEAEARLASRPIPTKTNP